MRQVTKRRDEPEPETEPVRVLGRGLRNLRGVRLTMRALREATGKTQLDVADDTKIDQADISRLEHREDFDDCQVSTLRRYVAALGGQLDVVAVFGNKRIVLSGTTGGASDASPPKKTLRRTARKESRR